MQGGVISMEKQLKYFKEYKARVEQYIGKERTKSLINKAVFIISAGTNDFIVNYYVAPIRRQTYTISTYQQFLLHLGQQFIQVSCKRGGIRSTTKLSLSLLVVSGERGLLELGARKIAFVGLPPMGCVPAVITINSDNAFTHRSCIESLSSVARDYNRMLLNKLTAMLSPGVKITYVDIYKPLDDMIKNPRKFAAARNLAYVGAEKSSISAIFIFGDSTVDPGNNNYISTPFRSNFSPYGKDFVNQRATGRFCNGRLANDFIANYAGIKEYVPPYLDPTLSIEELMSGNVIPISDQLQHFKEYQAKMEATIGKEKTKELINNALFLVSAGTNDFVVNYFTIPIRRRNYTIPSYMDFVLQHARQLFQQLVDEGARRIGVAGLPPMGCLPVVITLYSDNAITKRDCIDNFSLVARDYNQMLQKELNALQLQSGSRFAYLDIYGPLEDMALHRKYDFEEVSSGCCGTGMLEASFMCNPNSLYCADTTKYVFWDSIHPTEKAYDLVFQAFRPAIDTLIKN
ncbi:hypothetical protein BUALT_Bualt03G0050500 [Buddleja alternifolia]|uniref:GDSL esterase/lipase n=1 Tax=Buddleja alternifolia TaxID=168488 RepID=A0AAV6XZI8_9LAMI|nr:hypothetical protein BUALT_Bualt03G0050500 [Buddleja alternifolia]